MNCIFLIITFKPKIVKATLKLMPDYIEKIDLTYGIYDLVVFTKDINESTLANLKRIIRNIDEVRSSITLKVID